MKRVLTAIVLTSMLALTGLADTLYLRDGTVVLGRFLGYENGQFIFRLENGSERRYRPSEVVRLVIDREEAAPPPVAAGRWEAQPALEVRLTEQWVRTGIELRRGTRVRVTASGTITLDGRMQTGPDGLNGRRDPDAPMPNENDGALIAIIGREESAPEILIGRQREFTAAQEGTLYFTVNHWQTQNAKGAFRVEVALDRSGEGGAVEGGARPAPGRERTVTVSATQPWTDTGIDVTPEMAFEIVADGTIELGNRVTSGPDGNEEAARGRRLPVADRPTGSLIARIRYRDGRFSNIVWLGARSSPAAEEGEYGRLFLGINDDYFQDNRGSFTVRIRW